MTNEEAKVIVEILVQAHGGNCIACAASLLRSFNAVYPNFGLTIIDHVWEEHFQMEYGKNWIDWTEGNQTGTCKPTASEEKL